MSGAGGHGDPTAESRDYSHVVPQPQGTCLQDLPTVRAQHLAQNGRGIRIRMTDQPLLPDELESPRLDLDDGYCVGPVEDELRRLVNEERAHHGLAPVVHSKLLGQTATLWAHYTAETGVVAHVINGRKWSESIRASTYPNTWLGQVLAGGQPTPVEVVAAWMASETHRAVVLDERWAALGVALVEAPEARYVRFWAANFGAVADDPPPHCLEHVP